MLVVDVNILVLAFRADAEQHAAYRDWLQAAATGREPVGLPTFVLSSFVRIVTHPRMVNEVSELSDAISFIDSLLDQPAIRELPYAGARWRDFAEMCRAGRATGNLVPDAYIAAMAVEEGATLVTTDRDFARFPGLAWRDPVEV